MPRPSAGTTPRPGRADAASTLATRRTPPPQPRRASPVRKRSPPRQEPRSAVPTEQRAQPRVAPGTAPPAPAACSRANYTTATCRTAVIAPYGPITPNPSSPVQPRHPRCAPSAVPTRLHRAPPASGPAHAAAPPTQRSRPRSGPAHAAAPPTQRPRPRSGPADTAAQLRRDLARAQVSGKSAPARMVSFRAQESRRSPSWSSTSADCGRAACIPR